MGHLKIKETTKMFDSWEKNSKLWLKKRLKENIKADFIISDFVPEAFELAKILKIKSMECVILLGIGYMRRFLKKKKLKLMQNYINKADKIFFPPITENEILNKYKKILINKFYNH